MIVLAFYIITIFVNKTDDSKNESNISDTTIQYDYILVGNILTQPNKSYYVLSEISDDANVKIYEAYLSKYKNKDESLRVYYVALDNPLNSKYLKEESNFKLKNITDISFKETTLLLIENNKIKKTYEGKDNIIKILSELTKTD